MIVWPGGTSFSRFRSAALELVGGIVGVLHQQLELHVRRHLDALGHEPMLAEHQRRDVVGARRRARGQQPGRPAAAAIVRARGRPTTRDRTNSSEQRGAPGHELDARRPRGVADQGVQAAAGEAVVGQQEAGVPQLLAPARQQVGAMQHRRRLPRHAGGEQRDQRVGDAEQTVQRDGDQAAIQQPGIAAASASPATPPTPATACWSASQRRCRTGTARPPPLRASRRRRRPRRARPAIAGPAAPPGRPAQLGGHRAGVVRHPGDVPGQHDDSETPGCGGEDLLPGALEGVGQRGGKGGDQAGAGDARGDAAGDPAAAPGTPSVAARTMPTIRPASSASRNTMIRLTSMRRPSRRPAGRWGLS